MLEYAPASGSLALWVEHRDDDGIDREVVASNDGFTIRYGPSFEALPLPRQAGVVAHEVLHVALRHVPRYAALQRQLGEADLELFNICADAIVNSALDHLPWLEIDPKSVLLDGLLSRVLGIEVEPAKALLEWDVERLYRAIDDRRPRRARAEQRGVVTQGGASRSPSSRQKQRPGASTEGVDGRRADQTRALGREIRRDLVPSAEGGRRPEAEAERAREWRERVLRGQAGDGEHSLLRALLADLPKVRTPWEQLLRTQLAHGLSLRRARSWSRPSRSYIANQGRMRSGRRMPWEPGWSSGEAVARLAVMLDVSGSVDSALLRRFSAGIAAITRRQEARAVVIVGDDRVRSVIRYEPGLTDLTRIEFRGGGGTESTETAVPAPPLDGLCPAWGSSTHRPAQGSKVARK